MIGPSLVEKVQYKERIEVLYRFQSSLYSSTFFFFLISNKEILLIEKCTST
jgi:hypothetical protein